MSSEESKFFINIENELGLSYKKQRAKLLGVALSKPHFYYALRADIVDKLTTKQVKDAYKLYWDILKLGKINGTEILYTADESKANNEKLIPDLPEHLINKFASRVAATMEEIAEECVAMIMPEDFLKLAQEKQKEILSSKGII